MRLPMTETLDGSRLSRPAAVKGSGPTSTTAVAGESSRSRCDTPDALATSHSEPCTSPAASTCRCFHSKALRNA